MAKLTLVIEDELLRRAHRRALDQGTSVDALVRSYLESYAGRSGTALAMRAFIEHAAASGARSGLDWTREGLHER